MKTNHSKLQQRQQEDAVETQGASAEAKGQEFQSAEEAIRFDTAQTEVPPAVETRLAESIEKENDAAAAKDRTPWWKRLML